MTHAIRFYKAGGPEVLLWEDVEVGQPGPCETRVRHTAVGVNFVDIYIRSGLYPVSLPSGIGTEAAGRVQEVGPGVTEVAAGDRVAYAGGLLGAYAEERVVPADISDIQAAAMMLGPIDLGIFGHKGSLFFTRPTLNTYAAKRADLLAMAKDLFEVVRSGAVKIEVKQTLGRCAGASRP